MKTIQRILALCVATGAIVAGVVILDRPAGQHDEINNLEWRVMGDIYDQWIKGQGGIEFSPNRLSQLSAMDQLLNYLDERIITDAQTAGTTTIRGEELSGTDYRNLVEEIAIKRNRDNEDLIEELRTARNEDEREPVYVDEIWDSGSMSVSEPGYRVLIR